MKAIDQAKAVFEGRKYVGPFDAMKDARVCSAHHAGFFFLVFARLGRYEVEVKTPEEYGPHIGTPGLYTVYRRGESFR